MKKGLLFFLYFIIAFTWPASLLAKVYVTKEEALKFAFQEVDTIDKKVVFLSGEEQKRVELLAKAKLDTRIFTFYIGKKGENILGYAVFVSHVVRTKPEVYMVVINPDATIKNVHILAFHEPEEYLPPRRWFEQFVGRVLDDALWPKRGIRAVSGATLSVNGITQEIRKALAVFQLMLLKER